MIKRIDITDYGAVSGGEVLCTAAIQCAIDKAAELESEVYIPSGTYLTGALFLKSNMSMHLAKGAVLQGTTEESAYPGWHSETTDIKADCPKGLVNIFQASHVRVYGAGAIKGQGQSDYVRTWNVIVHECNDVRLEDFASVDSGFGNVHICYNTNVAVKGLEISNNGECGMDGIVIDCCTAVLVEQCRISCKNNNVSIMAGRDADSLQANPCCENIMVRGCEILNGEGITLVNENSGTMRNISICDNIFQGTRCGFGVKNGGHSAGLIEDVEVTNLKMEDVSCCFCFACNRENESETKAIPHVRNVRISQVTAVVSKENHKQTKAFVIEGLPEAPFTDFVLEDMQLQVGEYGTVTNVKNLRFVNVTVDVI